MFVFKAAVVGAGTMGAEIAQVIAAAEIPVVLGDVEPELVERGLARAREVTARQAAKLVERGGLSPEQAEGRVQEVMGRISGTTGYEGFGDVDLVVEAVPERIEVKHAVFAELDAATPGPAILASNTSALSITEIAQRTSRPDRVVGLHFFWPAAVMRLVEIVEGDETSGRTVEAAMGFAQAIRKQPIRCADVPGFVVNRILLSFASELWRVQDEEGVEPREVDRRIREAGLAPMGPFELADMTGLDVTLGVAEHLRASYGERFFVSPTMRRHVEDGRLGQKTGRGFYEHAG